MPVCLSVRSHRPISKTACPNFTNFYTLPVAVAWFSCGDSVIRYVVPVFMDDVIFAHNGLYGTWLGGCKVKVTHHRAAGNFSVIV